jgi:hypothetical protein
MHYKLNSLCSLIHRYVINLSPVSSVHLRRGSSYRRTRRPPSHGLKKEVAGILACTDLVEEGW